MTGLYCVYWINVDFKKIDYEHILMHSLSWIVSYSDCQGFNSINQHERVWLSPDMYFAVSPQEGARIIFKSTLNRTCRWPITANKVIFVPNHFLIGIFAVLLTTPEARKTKFTLRIFKIFSDLGLSLLLLVLLRILMLLLMIYINDMNEDKQESFLSSLLCLW